MIFRIGVLFLYFSFGVRGFQKVNGEECESGCDNESEKYKFNCTNYRKCMPGKSDDVLYKSERILGELSVGRGWLLCSVLSELRVILWYCALVLGGS